MTRRGRGLTRRQREAVALLLEGYSNAEIAARMDPPVRADTVSAHLAAAARSVGQVDLNRVQLAVWFASRIPSVRIP